MLAVLIAESEDGKYEPLAVVGSVSEAHEYIEWDKRNRRKVLDQGRDIMCPYVYRLWVQGGKSVEFPAK